MAMGVVPLSHHNRFGDFRLLSLIEQALYGDRGTHGVIELNLAPRCIRLRVAPWTDETAWVLALFHNVKLASLEEYAEGQDFDLPWDIIGFDSHKLEGDRWRFVLCCQHVELCFESAWPVIER